MSHGDFPLQAHRNFASNLIIESFLRGNKIKSLRTRNKETLMITSDRMRTSSYNLLTWKFERSSNSRGTV